MAPMRTRTPLLHSRSAVLVMGAVLLASCAVGEVKSSNIGRQADAQRPEADAKPDDAPDCCQDASPPPDRPDAVASADASGTDVGPDATAALPDVGGFDALAPDAEPCVGCPQCSDGIDNDGNGLVDWGFDLGCTTKTDMTENAVDEDPSTPGVQENGWTVFEPVAASRVIFVDSQGGRDSNPGTSPTRPKRTLNAAAALIRDGQPDFLFLKKGGTYSGAFPEVSGPNGTNPIVFAAYGASGAAPKVPAIQFFNGERNRFAVLGLDFGRGTFTAWGAEDIWAEGCRFADNEFHSFHFERSKRVRVAWNVLDRPDNSGIFAGSTDVLRIENNVILHTPDSKNHGAYITRGTQQYDVITKYNMVWLASRERGNGVMQRPGGLARGNVCVSFGWTCVTMGACNDVGEKGEAGKPPCEALIPQGIIEETVAIHGTGGINRAIEMNVRQLDDMQARYNVASDGVSVSAPSEATTEGNVGIEGPVDPTRPDLNMMELYHVDETGGSGNEEQFFEEAMDATQFRDIDERYTAQAVVRFARAKAGN